MRESRVKFWMVLVMALGIGVLLGTCAPAGAQTANQVYADEAFGLAANHDGVNTDSYTITITGPAPYSANLPVSSLVGGVITFPITPRTQTGNYTVIVTATGPGGATNSDPFALSVISRPVNAPSKATSLRIIRQ